MQEEPYYLRPGRAFLSGRRGAIFVEDRVQKPIIGLYPLCDHPLGVAWSVCFAGARSRIEEWAEVVAVIESATCERDSTGLLVVRMSDEDLAALVLSRP